ncbi:hypothetical protein PGTUg99_014005 [Puccinia graminis f. sp. tritici]|uniref:Uncharacterized protein n=1 Tax=Puccinia graminis f. sp. tritici TaxID=56615 RepID=A0A5B0M490_PUCGR|nr:hypothetical protein PGTUg99_014005 [Puccinia graminis f. sp. tritici]
MHNIPRGSDLARRGRPHEDPKSAHARFTDHCILQEAAQVPTSCVLALSAVRLPHPVAPRVGHASPRGVILPAQWSSSSSSPSQHSTQLAQWSSTFKTSQQQQKQQQQHQHQHQHQHQQQQQQPTVSLLIQNHRLDIQTRMIPQTGPFHLVAKIPPDQRR